MGMGPAYHSPYGQELNMKKNATRATAKPISWWMWKDSAGVHMPWTADHTRAQCIKLTREWMGIGGLPEGKPVRVHTVEVSAKKKGMVKRGK